MVNSYSKCMKQKKIKKYGKNKNEDNLKKRKKKSIAIVAKSFDMNSKFFLQSCHFGLQRVQIGIGV